MNWQNFRLTPSVYQDFSAHLPALVWARHNSRNRFPLCLMDWHLVPSMRPFLMDPQGESSSLCLCISAEICWCSFSNMLCWPIPSFPLSNRLFNDLNMWNTNPLPNVCRSSGGIVLYGPWIGSDKGIFFYVNAFLTSCLDKCLKTRSFSLTVVEFVFLLCAFLMSFKVIYLHSGFVPHVFQKRTTSVLLWSFQFPATVMMTQPFVVPFCITNEEMNRCTTWYYLAFNRHFQTSFGCIHVSESFWTLSLDSVVSVFPFPWDKFGIYAKGFQKLELFLAAQLNNVKENMIGVTESDLWRLVCVLSPNTSNDRGIESSTYTFPYIPSVYLSIHFIGWMIVRSFAGKNITSWS